MGEPLKHHLHPGLISELAQEFSAVWSEFPASAFVEEALDGFLELELMDRGRKVGAALKRALPADPERAGPLLVSAMGPPLGPEGSWGMAPFRYLPHSEVISTWGPAHFEPSLSAQHALTQRFTAEFSLRTLLGQARGRTLERLQRWAEDPSPHVRRAASEGTRPRLPWAARLPELIADPMPQLALLERLKDDESEYVRRSVANHLNDVGKDHPALLLEVAERWLGDTTARLPQRRALLRHALRSLLRAGHPAALGLLGVEAEPELPASLELSTPELQIGEKLRLTVRLGAAGQGRASLRLLLHFVGARGQLRPTVFRLGEVELGVARELRKTISFAAASTRRLYPGPHKVELWAGQRRLAEGWVELRAAGGG